MVVTKFTYYLVRVKDKDKEKIKMKIKGALECFPDPLGPVCE